MPMPADGRSHQTRKCPTCGPHQHFLKNHTNTSLEHTNISLLFTTPTLPSDAKLIFASLVEEAGDEGVPGEADGQLPSRKCCQRLASCHLFGFSRNKLGNFIPEKYYHKYRKNCECCSVSLFIVRSQRLSEFRFSIGRIVISLSNVASLLNTHVRRT